MVSFGDGFYAISHPDNTDLFLTESQGGNVVRTDMKNREQQLVVPFFGIGGAAENNKVRFNWNAPLIPSRYDKNTVYLAGSSVFRSADFGKTWTAISDDLTTNNRERLKDAGGPIFTENTSAEYYETIISLAESPIRRDMIYAGTDDGNLRVTMDGGKTWIAWEKNFRGLPPDSAVSHIEPSAASADVVYVSFDRHKLDDYKPYVFKTADGGKSFTNIAGNLPEKAYVHIVREDPKNANLIYAGTENGLYASWDGGREWRELNLKNLPRVAVHDILIHPRDNDLIIATHGRSVWVFDDATPIQQMTAGLLNETGHVFDIRPAYRYATMMTRYGVGDKIFRGQNPPGGAIITYLLKDKADEKTPVKMQVFDAAGKLIVENKNLAKEKGINRTAWNLSYAGSRPRRPPAGEGGFQGQGNGPQVLPGTYTVKIYVGDKLIGERRVEVRVDPTVQVTPAELQAQHDLALKLRDMSSSMNDGLRLLDSAKTQIDQIEATAKDRLTEVPADMTKAIADYKKRLNDILGQLETTPEDGSRAPARFSDQLGNLYGTISDGNFGPTPTMKENYELLKKGLPARIADIEKFIDDDTAKMNQTLQKFGFGPIVTGKKPEVPR